MNNTDSPINATNAIEIMLVSAFTAVRVTVVILALLTVYPDGVD